MPWIRLATTVAVPEGKRQELLAALSKTVALAIGKPEQYVMATLATESMLMSGQPGEAAWAEVRSIGGLTPSVNRKLASQLCELAQQSLGVSPNRVYLNFIDVEATHWGWRGETFG